MFNYYELLINRPDLFNNQDAMLFLISNKVEIKAWEKERIIQLRMQGKPELWGKIGIVYEDPYIIVLRDLVEFPNGSRNGYSRIINRATLEGGAAGVVVLPELNGRFLLLHQFRHATRAWHWEIPRGFGEAGKTAEQQAEIEIQEEVNGRISKFTKLGILHNNTGLEGNDVHLFLANLDSVGETAKDEGIESYIWVSIAELEEMIKTEKITDGFTIAAYTRAKLKGLI